MIEKILKFCAKIILKIISYDLYKLKLYTHREYIFGPQDRVITGKNVDLQNSLLNTVGGRISFGDNAFCGQNCTFVTGSHDYTKFNEERHVHPNEGSNIYIGKGVWICSGAIVLGGVDITDHCVIAAGAVVTKSCNECGVYAGIPAKMIKKLAPPT